MECACAAEVGVIKRSHSGRGRSGWRGVGGLEVETRKRRKEERRSGQFKKIELDLLKIRRKVVVATP